MALLLLAGNHINNLYFKKCKYATKISNTIKSKKTLNFAFLLFFSDFFRMTFQILPNGDNAVS